jgi:small acid-soluble spore protein K (minor)
MTQYKGGLFMVRNKDGTFPEPISLDGPRAKDQYASKRPNGTTRDHPQERMGRSNKRFT